MISISLPKPFAQEHLFQYLRRSKNEITFRVLDDNTIIKLFVINNTHLLSKIRFSSEAINISFINQKPSAAQTLEIEHYVISWFDLNTDLNSFYEQVKDDAILGSIINNFSGLRIVRCPDLFEALSWSIIGQQINLPFAYSCKKALVQIVGESINIEGEIHYAFPTPDKVLELSDEDFRVIKFSSQKVKYIRIVAEAIEAGSLSKESLELLDFKQAKEELLKLKGIGNWSANYTLMRCLGYKEAFPIADVGLQNALKLILKKSEKPSIEEIYEMAIPWKGWEAYATFYLWQTLL
ncbi:DNA-3-methyladenine glycosylase family protein [Arcticibacterium luteifluviistationis]|uniref:DNA-3-methyladenine glycosylase II n=1 Tax=Arcticibacterium luteifluviistationis TaxID=1784714 RepID=A0A2Z4GI71_9BACT|nr:DNA-3-methyladenine glycosylase [Arcticibacterium luteifluviistationis]AWW00689.1 DNA-3-methyladenine glycosylase [Arcticibacterium luteifluviistationis]